MGVETAKSCALNEMESNCNASRATLRQIMSLPKIFPLHKPAVFSCSRHGFSVYAALAASLFLHLALLAVWPVFAFTGKPAAQLRAGLRSMPVLRAAQGEVSATQSLRPLSNPQGRQRFAGEKPQQAVLPGTSAAARQAEEQGGASSVDYIPIELLDQKPVFLQDPGDTMSELADSGHGRVVVQLLISETGGVDRIVLESSELSTEATRRFLQQLGTVRLMPGMRDANPVKSRWRMEFMFEPISSTDH